MLQFSTFHDEYECLKYLLPCTTLYHSVTRRPRLHLNDPIAAFGQPSRSPFIHTYLMVFSRLSTCIAINADIRYYRTRREHFFHIDWSLIESVYRWENEAGNSSPMHHHRVSVVMDTNFIRRLYQNRNAFLSLHMYAFMRWSSAYERMYVSKVNTHLVCGIVDAIIIILYADHGCGAISKKSIHRSSANHHIIHQTSRRWRVLKSCCRYDLSRVPSLPTRFRSNQCVCWHCVFAPWTERIVSFLLRLVMNVRILHRRFVTTLFNTW